MNEQEAYLDELLNGLTSNTMDDANEDSDFLEAIQEESDAFSFDEISADVIEEIDEEEFFDGESSSFDDVDPLVLDSLKKEMVSGLDVTEFGFDEDDFHLDDEDLEFFYDMENSEEDSFDKESLFDDLSGFINDEVTIESEKKSEIEEIESSHVNAIADDIKMAPIENEEDEDERNDNSDNQRNTDTYSEEGAALSDNEGSVEAEFLDSILNAGKGESQADILPDEIDADDSVADIMLSGEEEASSNPENQNLEENMDDAHVLANLLSTFAVEDPDEKKDIGQILAESPINDLPLEDTAEEEAVLDTPENLGLQLEAIDDSEKSDGKKRISLFRKNKDSSSDEYGDDREMNLIERLLEDDADEEPTPEEIEAAEQKKAEKEEQKKAKKAEKEEKKKQAKEASAAKKAEKEAEKKRREEAEGPPEPWPLFTKKVAPMVVLFGITFVAVIVILTNVLSYKPYILNAREFFNARRYDKAYEQMIGLKIKEKDKKFFKQVKMMNRMQVKINAYNSHLINDDKLGALNDLIQAVVLYDELLEKAKELGLKNEFEVVYREIEKLLSDSFAITVEDARELSKIESAKEYQERLKGIVE